MKIPEQWLREQVAVDAPAEEIARRFDLAGLEVEALETVGGPLPGVVVARIAACERHPQADRLQLCQVDAGQGEMLQIVCGAPNARPGIKVPLATLGAELPGGMVIKPAKLRGIESRGMLCSARELGIADDASGLLELDDEAPVGTPLAEWLGLPERVFDLGLTPNRGDCLSLRGVGREVAAAFDAQLTLPPVEPVTAEVDAPVEIELGAAADCPRYCARVIRGVDASAPSPGWLRRRLRRAGLRPLSLLVDVTNYVMLELGQPLHAFDAAAVRGPIRVRRAGDGETLKLLDEREVALGPRFLLIADRERALAVAGVMGGWHSRVTPGTTDVLLEAAHFAPAAIVGRARALGLHTEASHRFERGVDPELPRLALERATRLVLDAAGGRPGRVCEAVSADDLPRREPVPLRRARVARVLGLAIDDAQIERILRALGMTQQVTPDGWHVTPPSWRFDVAIEDDLIEEVARIHGYDAIPTRLQGGAIGIGAGVTPSERRMRLREQLAARDYHEAVNYSFVPERLLQTWQAAEGALPLANPLSGDFALMRTSLLPGLVQTLVANQRRQRARVRLFELGRSYHGGADAPVEVDRLALVACGNAEAEQWGEPARPLDFHDLKGDLESLLGCGAARARWRFDATGLPSWAHPGRAARVLCDGRAVGTMGALHPRLAATLDLDAPVYALEMELAPLLQQDQRSLRPASRFPSLRRDIAIEVDAGVAWAQLRDCVRAAVGERLAEVRLFDLYSGRGVDAGRKSLAMGLILQDDSRTLLDEDADRAVALAVTALKHDFEARLRGEHGAD
ncbi:MAG TPA: phenylalanine--tRNA ligase subunit beta [Rhodanobacteraceae bacterium]|nr:phenylalanine--tRNA ligase subunit beta [Rhodanobacteraceae bacterium]